MPQHSRFPRERYTSQQGHRPRAGCRRKVLRENRRRAAGARFSARDRSPQWQALHQPSERIETRSDEAEDQEANEGGRMVGILVIESFNYLVNGKLRCLRFSMIK